MATVESCITYPHMVREKTDYTENVKGDPLRRFTRDKCGRTFTRTIEELHSHRCIFVILDVFFHVYFDTLQLDL